MGFQWGQTPLILAVRSIASANAKNHIAIVIPCHRVIAKNGGLAGFGGGV
jgi:O-6-methylguanine DNA methyltransferase